jgi:MYXO-CTERM domain-containing protein
MLVLASGLGSACVVDEVDAPDVEFRELVLTAPPEVARIEAPLPEAFCSIHVIGQRSYAIETDYLPRIVYCENGGADFEALKAQAIAARSVAYYEAALDGSICDSQSCQHASCEGSAAATLAAVPDDVFRAVEETSGMYLMHDGTLTYGFYVAGSDDFQGASCVGLSGDAATEKWVTYNDGRSGTEVEQTALGTRFDPDDREYGQNRGCMSQWGARCLEEEGFDAIDILRFYYGEDIEVAQAPGECVDDDASIDTDDECGDAACTGREDEDSCPEDCEPCGTVASQRATIIEENEDCFIGSGDPQYFHEEPDGHGGTLLWTESTKNLAYNTGEWQFHFEEAGDYLVEAYLEYGYADEWSARYRVTHGGEESHLRVDQSRAAGWIQLGVFDFEEGHHDQGLVLADLSGERGNVIVFDAVRLVPMDLLWGEDPDKHDDVDGTDHARGRGAGCSTAVTRPGPGALLALCLLALAFRRRRP